MKTTTAARRRDDAGRRRTDIYRDRDTGELVTHRGPREWTSVVAWPGFVGRDGAVPEWYAQAVSDLGPPHAFGLEPAHQALMVEAVRGATVITTTEADVNDYEYYPPYGDLKPQEQHRTWNFGVDGDGEQSHTRGRTGTRCTEK